MNSRKKILWLLFAGGMIFSFQNCGRGFQSATESLSSSAQCVAKIRAQAASEKLTAAEVNCGDFNAYACERRIFSPDVPDLVESIKECLPGDRTCVDVDVRQFNTSAARAAGVADASAFLPGGDYNYEEVHCHHRISARGVSLFEGGAGTLEEALAKAMSSCEQAVSK